MKGNATDDDKVSNKRIDRQPRQQQPNIVDKAVGDDVKDWTKSDVGRSVRILRIGTEAQLMWEIATKFTMVARGEF